MFKKALYLLLTLIFILNCVNIEVFAVRGYQSIWIEAEDCEQIGFATKAHPQASGGKKLFMITGGKPSPLPEIKVPFQITNEQNYDIWACILPSNVSHISKAQWSFDGSEYTDFAPKDIGGATMFTDSVYGLPYLWCKVGTKELERGKHQLTIFVPDARGLDARYIQGADAFAVVPTDWEWDPNTGSKPYNKQTIKAEFMGGKADKEQYNRRDVISVEVTNKVTEQVTGSPVLYAELLRNGEVVTSVTKAPDLSMSAWTPGFEYTDYFELNVPFNAANGVHEIRTGIVGINYSNGEESALVTEVFIGDKNIKNPERKVVSLTDITMPADISAGVGFDVSLKANTNEEIPFDTKPYITLWKEDVLWGVMEGSQTIETSVWVPGTDNELSLNFVLNEEVPKGSYTAEIGFHQLLTDMEKVNINLAVSKPDEGAKYKPMSHGFLNSKKTGLTHFWYVNQNCAMMRDGAPYIPLGGMVAFDYICYFDVNNPTNNEKNFEADKEFVQRMLDNNVTDIYINSRGFNIDYPTWAWEYLLDYLDERGINYGIQLNDRLDGAKHWFEAYYIRGIDNGKASVRVADVKESGVVSIEVPGNGFANYVNPEATGGKFIVINQATQEAVQYGDAAFESLGGGIWKFSADVVLPEGEDASYTVGFTPRFKGRPTSNLSNFIEFGDITVDRINAFAEKLNVGDHFTMWIDLCMNESCIANDMESARVFNDVANEKFAKYLEERYGTIELLNSSWGITPAVESFEKAALVIPLYTTEKAEDGSYGTYAVDAYTNEVYYSKTYGGRLWTDFTDFVSDMHRKFDDDMAEAAKEHIDAPVVYKETNSYSVYRVSTSENYGFDGVGSETYGGTATITGKTGSHFSQANASKKTVWHIVTETNTDENVTRKAESGTTSYPDEEYMHNHFDTLIANGAKGIYDFLISNNNAQTIIQGYSYEFKPDLYVWANNYRKKLYSKSSVDDLMNSGYRLDHGYIYPCADGWWVYPNIFTAVYYGGDMVNKSYPRTTNGFLFLPVMDPWVDTEMLVTNMSDAPASRIYGPALCEMLASQPENKKVVFVGARKDLGAVPAIDKYYTTETDVNADGLTVSVLKPTATSEILATTANGKPWAIRDGNLFIVAVHEWMTDAGMGNAEFNRVNYVDELGITDAQPVKLQPTFDDITNHWGKDEIEKAAKIGVVKGVEENVFEPETNVTRSQFVAMIIRAMQEKNVFYDLTLYKGIANDVTDEDWFAIYLQQAYELGYISDELLKDNMFMPEAAITREEMADIIVRVYNKKCGIAATNKAVSFADSGSIADWTKASVNEASALGLMEGVGENNFAPKGNVTRAQAAAAITRLLATIGME